MSVRHLRALVERYIARQINFEEFHQQFVAEFLCIKHQDEALQALVDAVAVACADHSEEFLGESALSTRLYRLVIPFNASAQLREVFISYVVSDQQTHSNIVEWASNSNDSLASGNPRSSNEGPDAGLSNLQVAVA